MKGTVRKPRTAGGTWSYRIDTGLDDRGRRRQREVGGFRTKEGSAGGAQRRALRLSARHLRGAIAPRPYVSSSTSGTRGPRPSWAPPPGRTTAQIIRRNIQPYVAAKRLTDLSPLDVKRWHGKLLEGGRKDGGPLSVASVKLAHRILHRALADAVRWNLIAVNLATGVRAQRGEPKEMTVWTAEEAKRFLEAMADDRLIALWTAALHTGLRRDEFAGLRWTDVDLRACTLTVAQQRTTANHAIVVDDPEGEESTPASARPATVPRSRGTASANARSSWRSAGVDR